MTTHKSVSLKIIVLSISVLFMLFAFKGEKDPLHKRTFTVMLDEVRDGVPAKKGISDKWSFKEGKMFSDYMYDKFGYKWMRYRINKDSIYTDSTDTEVRLLEVEASFTNEENQTVTINFTSVEWDLDGTVKITKNDKIKKYYDFVGREKGGKPKKEKKKKSGETKIFEIIDSGQEPSNTSPSGGGGENRK